MATDFQFDGELASSHGLIICTFDNATELKTLKNGADVEFVTSHVPNNNTWHHVNAQYVEVLSTTFQITKLQCHNEDENLFFTVQEQKAINRWLNRLDKYYPFRIIQDGFEHIYFNAQINVQKLELCGKVVGFELTVTTDKPYGYYDFPTHRFTIPANGTYSIIDTSDDVGNSDIIIKVTTSSSGTMRITNTMTNQIMIFTCASGETITIDTSKRKITSSTRSSSSVLSHFNFVWLNIGNTRTNKKNTLTFTLPATVEITYQPICKVSF